MKLYIFDLPLKLLEKCNNSNKMGINRAYDTKNCTGTTLDTNCWCSGKAPSCNLFFSNVEILFCFHAEFFYDFVFVLKIDFFFSPPISTTKYYEARLNDASSQSSKTNFQTLNLALKKQDQ